MEYVILALAAVGILVALAFGIYIGSTVTALKWSAKLDRFKSKLDNKDMIIDNLHLELKKQMEKKYKWWIDY